MGWITGLIMFGIWTVVLTALALPAAISGHLISSFQEQIKNSPWQDPAMLTQMTRRCCRRVKVWRPRWSCSS